MTPHSPLRVGLVGAGRIAQLVHLPALAAADGLEVVGIVEPNDEARVAAGTLAPRATLYTDLDRMLEEPTVEAIVVAAPTALHAEIARRAFDADRAVYLEKPIAVTLDEAATVLEAAQGHVGMSGLVFRFARTYQRTRSLLQSGAIGEIVAVRTVFTSAPRELPAWKQTRATGGGVLLDLLSHHADLVAWLIDAPIVEASARIRSVRSEADTASVQLELASGVSVQTFVSSAAAAAHCVEVVGTEGRLVANPWAGDEPDVFGTGLVPSRAERLRAADPRRALHRPDFQGPFRRAFETFAEAARLRQPVQPSLQDGWQSLAVVEAAERSSAHGGQPAAVDRAGEIEATEAERG
ncbi:MAG: Gfo/Idh/MocA family oxidoreductase [Rubricoccaceae bacterium]